MRGSISLAFIIYILTPFVLVLVGLLFLGSICASVLTVCTACLLNFSLTWPCYVNGHATYNIPWCRLTTVTRMRAAIACMASGSPIVA